MSLSERAEEVIPPEGVYKARYVGMSPDLKGTTGTASDRDPPGTPADYVMWRYVSDTEGSGYVYSWELTDWQRLPGLLFPAFAAGDVERALSDEVKPLFPDWEQGDPE